MSHLEEFFRSKAPYQCICASGETTDSQTGFHHLAGKVDNSQMMSYRSLELNRYIIIRLVIALYCLVRHGI